MSRPPIDPEDTVHGWRRLAWGAYEQLPRWADVLLRIGTRTLLPLTNRRVPLTVLRGPVASGGAGAMLLAGANGAAAAYLAHRFFVAEPAREALAAVPIWRLRAELARRRASVDLVVARLDRISATLALDASYVAVPEWVGARAPVPADARQFCRGRKSLSSNMARGRRAGLQPEVSHEMRDFHDFYDRMYVPFVRRLHGTEAMVSNRPRLRRCFRQGGVLWAVRDGERVAGVLYRTRGRTLDMVVVGTAGGDLGPWRDGAGFALELFLIEHAHALGCTVVDLGGSRPSPNDGLLAYKARWNARVVTNRTAFYDLCLAWDRLTPPLLAFLTRTPLIFRQSDGLAALWASVEPRPEIGAARAVLQSLRRLYLLGDADDASTARLEIPIIRVDPAAQPEWRPGKVPA